MEQTENPAREHILQRIRKALSAPAEHPSTPTDERLFAPVSEILERFEAECAGNHTECVLTTDSWATAQAVAEVLRSTPAGEVFMQDAPSLRRLAANLADRTIHWSSNGRPSEEVQATVTLAEALVAQTGSIFVSSACGGRAATVAAPVHVVVANRAQLVPDLQTLFAQVSHDDNMLKNSMLCLTTGSSRTGDIEKILVLGAHGPRRLVVVLQEE
ncbi:MAG TPA: LUD domain-containing protein [Terriglobales bacterium]|nr:LUD domain-containing protein [Terriglobales bacterium]